MFFLTDCDCPKAKPRPDGKEVIDSECDAIGECFCPLVSGVPKVTFTDGGCVLDRRLQKC